jgi:hypothetical protein
MMIALEGVIARPYIMWEDTSLEVLPEYVPGSFSSTPTSSTHTRIVYNRCKV